MTALDSTACPKCGKACSLMAGVNVYRQHKAEHESMFLVCWDDEMALKVGGNGSWESILQKSMRPPQWFRHTPYHWSMMIGGKKLDYWPTKKKWQWQGEVRKGDIDSFIRTLKAEHPPVSEQFAE